MVSPVRLLFLAGVALGAGACRKSVEPAPPLPQEEEWRAYDFMLCEEKLTLRPRQFIQRYDRSDETGDVMQRDFLVDEYVECHDEAMKPRLEALPPETREHVKRLDEVLARYLWQRYGLLGAAAGGDELLFRRQLQDEALTRLELIEALVEGLSRPGATRGPVEPEAFTRLDALVEKSRKLPEDILGEPSAEKFSRAEKEFAETYARLKQELSQLPEALAAPFIQHLVEVTDG